MSKTDIFIKIEKFFQNCCRRRVVRGDLLFTCHPGHRAGVVFSILFFRRKIKYFQPLAVLRVYLARAIFFYIRAK